jgi:N-acetylglucosamine kinase-like BadF-type ATPase
MSVVIGIDGGGTKTAAVILDCNGRILGTGEGGPSTFGVVPVAMTQTSIARAAREAAAMAGLDSLTFSAAFLGLGNVVSERDRNTVREIAAGLGLADRAMIGVDHDIRIALAGGLSGRPGMVLIAGTGTSCFGINPAGETWRSGGWGPLIDDEGSSYWLGIQAMRAAVLDYDGRGEQTLITQAISDRLALADMNELMNRLYAAEMTRTEIASLAPLVFDAVERADGVAQALVRRGCQAMAACAQAVARKLGLENGPSELAITGGLTNADEALLAPFRAAVAERLPGCQVKKAELTPATGAALLALERTGKKMEPGIIAEVHKSGKTFGLAV